LVEEAFDGLGMLDRSLWAVNDQLGTVHDLIDGADHALVEHREWDNDAELYYNRARWLDSNTG